MSKVAQLLAFLEHGAGSVYDERAVMELNPGPE